jgi:hypothetical protein
VARRGSTSRWRRVTPRSGHTMRQSAVGVQVHQCSVVIAAAAARSVLLLRDRWAVGSQQRSDEGRELRVLAWSGAPTMSSAAPKKSMWWQAGPFEQWVQEVLISVLVPEGASVCELMCGSGKALGKWQRAKLGQYVGVGASALSAPPTPPAAHLNRPAATDAAATCRCPGARHQRGQAAVGEPRAVVPGALLRR